MHTPFLSSPSLASLAAVLFASLWQGSLLVLLVAGALRLFPGLTSAARAAIWAAALVLIALHPLLALAGHGASTTLSPHAGLLHVERGVSLVFVALWVAASLFRLGQLVTSAAQLWLILHAARPLASTPAITALLRRAPRQPQLCVSAKVQRPSVAGFLRPRLLLPSDLLTDLNEVDLTQVVLHELEHLRRGDDWVNLLQQVALVLLPLHPALFWLNRRLALERELACDDAVLATTGAGVAYATCLTHVAERSLLRRGLSLALGALGSPRRRSELTARVERILRRPEHTLSGRSLRLATGLVLAGTAVTSGLLARAPGIVNFGPAPVTAASVAGPGDAFRESRMLPVVARMPGNLEGGSRTLLLKASLRTPATAGRSLRTHAAPRRVTLRSVHRTAAPRVLLTDWTGAAPTAEIPAAPQRVSVVFTRGLTANAAERQQVWYTAVRLPDGWLVVEL